jgi:hypothetical protein
MDVSKLKDIIQKLGFIRNYSSLLVPVAIVMVGVLLFIPTQLMSSKLKDRMADESVSIGQKVRSLSGSAVVRDQWQVEQEYQQAYGTDANQIALLAKQSSQRELLSYKIFPEPKDISTLIFKGFGQEFRGSINQLIAHVNGRDCPTETELQQHLQRSSTARSSRRVSLGILTEVDAAITDVLCRERAESTRFYINPADFDGYKFWEQYEYAGMEEAVKDCWYWQLGYWIIEDVINTIDAIDSGSSSIFASPVKRLISVSFTLGDKTVGKKTADIKRPSYVRTIADGFTESYTGRLSDKDIDVVHFNVVVVVSTDAVLSFMKELCSAKQHKFSGFLGNEQEQIFKHNQITILESSIRPINREDKAHLCYRYGEDAVVELDLICEYIFNKAGYDEIKPEAVKKEPQGK